MVTATASTTSAASAAVSDTPLRVVDAAKVFGDQASGVRAVDGVSFDVRAGRFLAIMGQSGSGKSTLLHMAGGLTEPTSGQILVDGEDLATLDDRACTLFRRRKIGLIFQSFNLIPTLSAVENVELPRTLDKADPAETRRRAVAMLERLGLGHRASHRPDTMSGGEQQRVAIARALVTDPALILADEPTGNLDSQTGEIVCDLLRGLADEGRTIVMVTHEPAVAAYAHEALIMRDGNIISRFDITGDARDVADAYQRAVA